MAYGHVLAKSDFPRGREDGSHVVISCINHLAALPKLINLGWGVSVSETKFTNDGDKALFLNINYPRRIGRAFGECALTTADMRSFLRSTEHCAPYPRFSR